MRDPQLINADEDTRMIPLWSMAMAAAVFVLVEYYFWLVFPPNAAPCAAPGTSHLSEYLLGIGGRSLFSDGGFRKQGCAPKGDEFTVLDVICSVMPGGIGAVLYFLLPRPWFRGARPARRMCKAISISARSATTSSVRAAETASGRFEPRIILHSVRP